MSGVMKKIVDCIRNGEMIASYPVSYGSTLGQPPFPPDLIAAAKSSLIMEGFVKPFAPFDFTGIEFRIRDDY